MPELVPETSLPEHDLYPRRKRAAQARTLRAALALSGAWEECICDDLPGRTKCAPCKARKYVENVAAGLEGKR